MKKFNDALDEKALEQLLREFILEEDGNALIKNDIDMNAELVLNGEAASHTFPRSAEMISKLEHQFLRANWFKAIRLNILLFAIVLVAGFIVYRMLNKEEIAKSAAHLASPANKNAAPPAAVEEASSNDTLIEPSASPAFIAHNDSLSHKEDSVVRTAPSSPRVRPQQKLPPYSIYDHDLYPAPDPVFAAKPSPENYKAKRGILVLDSANKESAMLRFMQDSIRSLYYTGEPFKKGMSDMHYVNYGEYVLHSSPKNWVMPLSVLGRCSPHNISVRKFTYERKGKERSYHKLAVEKLDEEAVDLAMQPFYFRKFEVTNKEYREFLNWVRHANGYGDKAITRPITETEKKALMERAGSIDSLTGNPSRFKPMNVPVEDYHKVFTYTFFDQPEQVLSELKSNRVYVYPDTNAWMTDFSPYSFNEPLTNMYFWHPAYDDYPVVGVNWFQAMAFLDWKTRMHQQQLDKENVPYTIEYSLPSHIEWELVSLLQEKDSKAAFAPDWRSDNNWLTDLAVVHTESDDSRYNRMGALKNFFTRELHYPGNFSLDGYFHTGPADLSKVKKLPENASMHIGPFGISWMDGNASEWMSESYKANWKPFFNMHFQVLDSSGSEEQALIKSIEMFYDKGNAPNGRLIKGANFYDERFGEKSLSGFNRAGIVPKRYIDPFEQHCTIGFRYVVRVRLKNEGEAGALQGASGARN